MKKYPIKSPAHQSNYLRKRIAKNRSRAAFVGVLYLFALFALAAKIKTIRRIIAVVRTFLLKAVSTVRAILTLQQKGKVLRMKILLPTKMNRA